MADTLKSLYKNKPGTSNGTLYLTPASTTTIVKSVVICNTTSDIATITLKAGGQFFVNAYSVTANNTIILNDVGILEAGELLEGSQGTSSAISVWISGMEVV